jgi:hypothetical protein
LAGRLAVGRGALELAGDKVAESKVVVGASGSDKVRVGDSVEMEVKAKPVAVVRKLNSDGMDTLAVALESESAREVPEALTGPEGREMLTAAEEAEAETLSDTEPPDGPTPDAEAESVTDADAESVTDADTDD